MTDTVQGNHDQAARRWEQPTAEDFRDFFENAAIPLHWIGPDGTILLANQAELDLLGYAREEYVGHHIAEFHIDQAASDALLARVLKGESVRDFEARLLRRDGSIRYVLIDSNPLIRDGRFIRSGCVTRDVTAQKESQRALRADQARLELALRAGRLGTWDWQVGPGKVVWSESLEEIHGLTPRDIRRLV